MKWKHPPIIKLYEALGAMADGRVEVGTEGNTARVKSSSGNKSYTVTYDADARAIMANDNGSYWKGYLGYPAIAYLLATGVLEYQARMGELLKDIPWKDLNQKFKNDFEQTLAHILGCIPESERAALVAYVEALDASIIALDLHLLGTKQSPPEGY